MLEIKRKEGESASAFLYRFTKKVQQSGLIKEAKKRRATSRPMNKTKRKEKALFREARKREVIKARKLGK